MSQLYDLSLSEVRDLLRTGDVTAEAATAACLERIAATEPNIEALLHVAGEAALEQARAMDAKGPDASRPLWGVPILMLLGLRLLWADR